MRIALISAEYNDFDVTHNIACIEQYAERLASEADVVVFGEAYLHGFNGLTWNANEDVSIAFSIDSPELRQLCMIAKHYCIAISTGYFELVDDTIYSSNIFIGSDGNVVDNFRRVSEGWKNFERQPDETRYLQGDCFHAFTYKGKTFSVALCGDLWYDNLVNEMSLLHVNAVLWPVCINYSVEEWKEAQFEYARQVSTITVPVLMTNNFNSQTNMNGGCYVFHSGKILSSFPLGSSGVLIVDV